MVFGGGAGSVLPDVMPLVAMPVYLDGLVAKT